MQKTAQKRSILNKIREMANIPGASVEGFFEPEMKRVMNSLREADDNIRTILSGQKIGKATIDPPDDTKSLKDILKSARSNFNRREYMAGVADLGRFHKRMYDVSKFIEKLRLNVDQIHHNFLFQDLSEQDKERIKKLREHMSSAASVQLEYFIKEAGIMDFFYNIGTQRGRALATWEKKYPKVAKDIRDGGLKLLDQADNTLTNTLFLLKEMATARAVRKVDDYMESAHKIQSEYGKFDGGERGFKAYYNNIVQPWIQKFDEWEKSRESAPLISNEQQGQTNNSNIPIPLVNQKLPITQLPPPPINPNVQNYTTPTVPVSGPTPAINVSNSPSYTTPTIPVSAPLMTPVPASMEPEGNEFKSDQLAKEMWQSKKSHINFINSLDKMSNESPKILANYINKYATLIQNNDLETAIQLFNIAKQLK